MRNRRFAVSLALLIAGLPSSSGAAEESNFVREAMTVESHKLVGDKATRTLETLPQIVDVAVYRPDDGLKHPAIVYLHGGGMSFADTSMQRFHIELARRGLVVLAPHYLLNGTGWPHWHETAVNTVTLAASLPSVDPESIGMAGISMGGQIGLSTAARDPRIKAVAEFFTAWPGSLPDEPIDKLPPVLLLNGTADPIIPFDVALVLDDILTAHHLPLSATSTKAWATDSVPPPPSTTASSGRPPSSAAESMGPGRLRAVSRSESQTLASPDQQTRASST